MRTLKILLLTAIVSGVAAVAGADWDSGVAAFKAGQWAQASQAFQEVVSAQPDFAGGHYMLGQSLLKQDKNQEALSHLRKAYELESSNLSYVFGLAKGYFDSGRYNEALQMLEKINRSSLPKAQQSVYQQMRAVALSKTGRADEALQDLREIAQGSNTGSAWYSYGSAALSAGEIDRAVDALERAVRLEGDSRQKQAYINALIQQARSTDSSSAKNQAYATAVPVAQSLPANYENLLTLGEVQLGAGQYTQAVASLEKAKAQNANDFYVHFYQAQALTALDRWQQAASAAEAALQRARQDRVKRLAWRQLGFVHEKMKNYEEAIAAYRNAGDPSGVRRVEENQRIAEENKEVEEHNRQIEELRKEEEALQEALEDLQGGGKPPLR